MLVGLATKATNIVGNVQRTKNLLVAIFITTAMIFAAVTTTRDAFPVPQPAGEISTTHPGMAVSDAATLCDKDQVARHCCSPLHCTPGIPSILAMLAFLQTSSLATAFKTDSLPSRAPVRLDRPPKAAPLPR